MSTALFGLADEVGAVGLLMGAGVVALADEDGTVTMGLTVDNDVDRVLTNR